MRKPTRPRRPIIATKQAIMRNGWSPCSVEIESEPDALGRQHFTLDWIEQGGRRRGQCFFAKLSDHVLLTAADFRMAMGRRLGCVALRVAKRTGTLVALYRTQDSGLDPEIGPWAVVCETHGAILGVQSREAGRSALPDSSSFCEGCRSALQTKGFLGSPAGPMLGGSS